MEKISNSESLTPTTLKPSKPVSKLLQDPFPLLNPSKIGKLGKGLKSTDPQTNSSQVSFFPITDPHLLKDPHSVPKHQNSKDLTYKLHKTEARLVRSILEQSGFSSTDSHDWNLLWLGAAPQLYLYENLHDFQRINHFPNSFEITRKDRMSFNLKSMQSRFPVDYNFFPETFVIPDEYTEFYHRYNTDKNNWIVKPCNSSQGKGIFLLDNLNNLPSAEGCVVSKYLSDPLLIGGLKFDLRIYVLVTSYEPLKIYVYDEGLVRFASEQYSNSMKASKFAFLTNYSVNKKNEKFVQNVDVKKDNVGHKWSLSALMKYLDENKKDSVGLTAKIYDLVVKTIVAIEPAVSTLCKKLVIGKNNCFDLLGFDIIIDSGLKPWLLEVNLSPSLATDSPLDLFIKSNLVADTLNIVGIRQYDRKKECLNKLKARIKARKNQMKTGEIKTMLNKTEVAKAEKVSFCKFKLAIADLVEEASKLGNFVRIFPSEGCEAYDKFFLIKRKSNKALLTFLYTLGIDEPDSQPAFDLDVNKEVEKEVVIEEKEEKAKEEKDKTKILITGDDILIEYLSRVMHATKSVGVEKMKNEWKAGLDKFVSHCVWDTLSSADLSHFNIIEKVNVRVCEMKEGRNKAENSVNEFYLSQKHQIVRKFSALQLENMIKGSNKSLAKEVMCSLFVGGNGILTEIIKWLASSSMRKPKKGKPGRRTGSISTNELEKMKDKGYLLGRSESYLRSGSYVMKNMRNRLTEKILRPKTRQERQNSVELE